MSVILLLLLASVALAQEVCFYEDLNYTGAELCGREGDRIDVYRSHLNLNDRFSSVRVPAGLQVVAYAERGFHGTNMTYQADSSTLGSFDNVISSFIVQSATGVVSFITQLQQSITVIWQPPLLIDGLPVLHYVVSYNTSDNSTLILTQVNSSMSSYTVSGEPGVTYYITVFAVNALGPGPMSKYSIVNIPLLPTITSITLRAASTTSQLHMVDTSVISHTTVNERMIALTAVQLTPTVTLTENGNESIVIITTVTASVLVLSVISTAIITSIIVWCVMRRRLSHTAPATGTSTDHGDKGVTDLATVIYETCAPITDVQHTVTTEHNTAYGRGEGSIPLKHNDAYQKIYF